MKAVWLQAAGQMRRRWRALVVLTLFAGLGGGVALAAFAGARRTNSAYPDFVRSQKAYDVILSPAVPPDRPINKDQTIALFDRVSALPQVLGSTIVDLVEVQITGGGGRTLTFPDVFPIADEVGHFGSTLNGWRIVHGRLPNQDRANEAIASPAVAALLHVPVNGEIGLHFEDGSAATVRLVGVGWAPGQLDPSSGDYFPVLDLTHAFYQTYASRSLENSNSDVLLLRLRGGTAAIPRLLSDAARAGAPVGITGEQATQTVGVARSTRFEVVGLQLFGGLAALAVLAIFAQLVAREIFFGSSEYASLRAMGMTRGQLVALAIAPIGGVGVIAGSIAIVVAFALSSLSPIGLVRQVADHGLAFDGLVLGAGAAGIIIIVLVCAFGPGWRASRATAAGGARFGEGAGSGVANLLARGSFPPSSVAGVGMALEPGRGSSSVPVRSTILSVIISVLAFAAAVSFGSSIQRLVKTPVLAGWRWDAIVYDDPSSLDAMEAKLTSNGTLSAVGRGTNAELKLGALDEGALAFDGGSGPELLAGHLPVGPHEIALGSKTMSALHVSIGKTIPVQLLPASAETTPILPQPVNATPYPMRVVGEVVLPSLLFSAQQNGHGAVVTFDMLRAIDPKQAVDSVRFIRFAHGVALQTGLSRIKEILGGSPGVFVLGRSRPSTLTNLQQIADLPDILAGLLGLLAIGTIAHTLLSSVRRRRKDLAILKTLGFVRGQVRATVIWQATTIVVIALVIGLPLGAIAGRLGWRTFVDQLGFVPDPVIPLLTVLLSIPAAIVVANVIASIPARAAARTQPAIALRAE